MSTRDRNVCPSGLSAAVSLCCAVIFSLCLVLAGPSQVQARPNTADLFVEALLANDADGLDVLLASNFVFIGSNGHIQDKAHFLETIRSGKLKIVRARFRNQRESSAGPVRMLTGNGEFTAISETVLPSGLMRFTLVAERADSRERVVLVQLTPVIPTEDCRDGNCLIR
ncbi:MAG: nuclear transport factor 2 family protein [Desulfovibrionaceae bacterium]|nr:nuclear transport factor 2 family protein [Desulfovibrionaceae bacterium]